MVKKVTVSLPDELLGAIDAESAERGRSRSGVVQEAAAHYLAHTEQDRDAEARKLRITAAASRMKAIRELPSSDTRSTLEVLRAIREDRDSAAGDGTQERSS